MRRAEESEHPFAECRGLHSDERAGVGVLAAAPNQGVGKFVSRGYHLRAAADDDYGLP